MNPAGGVFLPRLNLPLLNFSLSSLKTSPAPLLNKGQQSEHLSDLRKALASVIKEKPAERK